MILAARIAWRYLKSKKSHGAVSAIAAVSVTGVAIATAAIVCVLSVFNGFREVLVDRNDRTLPDVAVTQRHGHLISDGDSLAEVIAGIEGVRMALPVVEEQALAIFDSNEMPVVLRGVDASSWSRMYAMDSLLLAGETLPAAPMAMDPPAGLISVGTAMRIKAYSPGDVIFLFAPRRVGRINLANPATSFFTDSVLSVGVFESGRREMDDNTIVAPMEVVRGLFQYDAEATSVEVQCEPGVDPAELGRRISVKIGDGYDVSDRMRQQEVNFRMVEIEKWVTGMLLLFILVIASFNIISTLTMFVLEKRRSMQTLRALGMPARRIGAVFGWESVYVTLIGGAAGMALGVVLCLIQERFGLIKLHGDSAQMILRDYPVKLEMGDMWMVAVPIVVIGLLTAWIAASFAHSRISERHR